jgi:outer membrane protein OmpA-like peptidoglycan-associated protein
MMISRTRVAVLLACALAGPAAARADDGSTDGDADGDSAPPPSPRARRSVELGVFVGVHAISLDTTLVRLDGMPNSPPTTGIPLGLRLGWSFADHFALDLEGTMQYATTGDRQGTGFVATYRGLLRWRINGDSSRFRPFFVAGGGGESGYVSRPLRSDSGTILGAIAGGGLELGVAEHVGLRIDARAHLVPGDSGLATDIEVVLGVCWAPGGSCGWHAPPTQPDRDPDLAPPTPKDTDHDGVFGALDKCPLRPEDKDGFQDDDGCPDPDNDKDGVDDTHDHCPDASENLNGFEDDDGCPDTLPDELADFEGIVPGLIFRPSSAVFEPRSFDTLDRLAEAMKKYPDVHLKIIAHTSSAGAYGALVQLSEQRADAIEQYLVDKGIDAARIEATGVGPDTPIADNDTPEGRAINERIEMHVVGPPSP